MGVGKPGWAEPRIDEDRFTAGRGDSERTSADTRTSRHREVRTRRTSVTLPTFALKSTTARLRTSSSRRPVRCRPFRERGGKAWTAYLVSAACKKGVWVELGGARDEARESCRSNARISAEDPARKSS